MTHSMIRRLVFLLVVCLPCALPTHRVRAESQDAGRQLTVWLESMGLAPYLSVQSVAGPDVKLRGSSSFAALLDQCAARRCKLIDRVFFRAVNATALGVDRMSLRIQGPDPCLRVMARWKGGRLQTEEDRCRDASGEAEIPPDVIDKLIENGASGRTVLKRRAGVTELRRQLTAAATKLKGKIDFSAEGSNQLQFDLRGMKGRVLQGDGWWESVSVTLRLIPGADASAGPTLFWTASGGFAGGLGEEPPPIAAYEQDFEPKHKELLQKFVGKLINDVVNQEGRAPGSE